MSPDEIQTRLTTVLQDVFDDDSLVAAPELTASDVYGWDSFAHIRLIMNVERAFSINFSAAQVEALQNVGDLLKLIESKTAG